MCTGVPEQCGFLFSCPPAHVLVVQQVAIDDIIASFGIDRTDFCLLLSDAAPYMVAAAKTLKMLYPRLFRVTCLAHLMHNCAIRVKTFYQRVDALIAAIKASVVKNRCRKHLFDVIGQPPTPILTRWGSWIDAAMHYADNLPEVKRIDQSFTGEGVLVSNAKTVVANATLAKDLAEIKTHYSQLANYAKIFEDPSCSIMKVAEQLSNIDFGTDPCGDDIAPSLYGLLQGFCAVR